MCASCLFDVFFLRTFARHAGLSSSKPEQYAVATFGADAYAKAGTELNLRSGSPGGHSMASMSAPFKGAAKITSISFEYRFVVGCVHLLACRSWGDAAKSTSIGLCECVFRHGWSFNASSCRHHSGCCIHTVTATFSHSASTETATAPKHFCTAPNAAAMR